MAGPNTTGKPKTDDYNLGRGILYASDLDANGLPHAFRDLGNAPAFKISIKTTTLDHKSSRGGLAVVDKSVVIEQQVSISCELDELNNENLALLFSGTKASHTNPAIAGFTIITLIANAYLQTNSWYDLKDGSGSRLYDVAANKIALATSAGTPVALVNGTDYELDREFGRVFIKDTAKITTAISGGGTNGNITLVCTADASASPVEEVQVLTQTNVLKALKFIGSNPANNDAAIEYQFHQVQLNASGDFSLIGDTFTTMAFDGTAQSNIAADANSPTCTIRTVTTPR